MRETGPVRKDISGDPEAAAPYMGMARTLLGKLKARMAAGGLAQLSHAQELPDGTVISVMSRHGQDTVRIFAAVPPGRADHPGGEQPWTPPREDWAPDEPVIEPPVIPQPYMWVGARYRWEDYGDPGDTSKMMPYTDLLLVVVEPGDNGVLMADNPVVWAAEKRADAGTQTLDLAAMQADFSGGYASQSPVGVPAGAHNFGVFDADSRNTMMFSKNGLRLYSSASCQDLTNDVFTPFDPLAASGASRFVPADAAFVTPDYQAWAKTHGWDMVAVLDPWEDQAAAPFDPRVATAWSRRLLARSGAKMGLDGVLAGNYEIVIGAFGEYRVGSDRSGSQSPYLPSGVGWRYGYDDFREHLTRPWSQPLRVEIEVRLGKLPYMTTQRFTIEVPAYDSWSRTTVPYGSTYDGSGCAYYQGGNPLAMNWYSGAILVNPLAGTAALKPGYVSRIFQPAAYNLNTLREKRYPVDIYYMTLGNADPANTGAQLFRIMDMQCCGYFSNGANYELIARSAADVQGAAGGLATMRVYRYDNAGNTFTDVGPYTGLTDFRAMADPLGAASLANCHLPIFCASDGSISANYWGWPTSGPCCADSYFGN
jgi:hypothetical protein